MNVVTLVGNLATEVELREVAPDKRVASFVLAVDRASREGGADFVTVSASAAGLGVTRRAPEQT